MKPYGKREYSGWSHYGRKSIKKLAKLELWDDLSVCVISKKAARREGFKEIDQQLLDMCEDSYE